MSTNWRFETRQESFWNVFGRLSIWSNKWKYWETKRDIEKIWSYASICIIVSMAVILGSECIQLRRETFKDVLSVHTWDAALFPSWNFENDKKVRGSLSFMAKYINESVGDSSRTDAITLDKKRSSQRIQCAAFGVWEKKQDTYCEGYFSKGSAASELR